MFQGISKFVLVVLAAAVVTEAYTPRAGRSRPILFNRDIARLGYVPAGYKSNMRAGYNPVRRNYRNSRLTIPTPKVVIPKPVPMKVYVPHKAVTKKVYVPHKAVQKKVYVPHKAVSHGKAYYPSKVYNQNKNAVNPYKKVANPYKKVHNPYTDVHTPYRAQDVYNSHHRNVNRRANGNSYYSDEDGDKYNY